MELFLNIPKHLKTYATSIDRLSAGEHCYFKLVTYLLLSECLDACKPSFC